MLPTEMARLILNSLGKEEDRLVASGISSAWREAAREPAAEALAQRIRQGDVAGAVAELRELTYEEMLHLLHKATVRIARAEPEDLPQAVAVVNKMIDLWPDSKDGLLVIVFNQLRSKRSNPSTRRYDVMGDVKLTMWSLIERHYVDNELVRGNVLASLRKSDPVFDKVPMRITGKRNRS
jgi:hypothetical protein